MTRRALILLAVFLTAQLGAAWHRAEHMGHSGHHGHSGHPDHAAHHGDSESGHHHGCHSHAPSEEPRDGVPSFDVGHPAHGHDASCPTCLLLSQSPSGSVFFTETGRVASLSEALRVCVAPNPRTGFGLYRLAPKNSPPSV